MEKNRHLFSRTPGVKRTGWIPLAAIVVLAWLAGPAALRAQSPESGWTTDQILSHVKQSEQTLKTFSASFRQVQTNPLLLEPLTSRGTLFYRDTGEILMKISFPEPFLLLIKDRVMITGDPVAGQYRQKTIPGKSALLKQYFGIGQTVGTLKQRYEIRSVNQDLGSACTLILTPKPPGRRMPFRSIQIRFDTRRWLPTGIRLEQADDDRTEIEWTYLTINQPLPPELFAIDIPPEEMDDPFEPH